MSTQKQYASITPKPISYEWWSTYVIYYLPIFTESKISTILLCAPGFQGAAEENLVVREKQQPSAAGAATSTVEDSNVCETLVAAVALTELNHSALKSFLEEEKSTFSMAKITMVF